MRKVLVICICAALAFVVATWTVDIGVIKPQSVSAQSASTCPGDFNGDGKVNLADFLAFAGGFGTRSGDANYNARLDMNGSGAIDLSDFLAFAGVFGTTCEDRSRGSVSGDRAALVALYNATDGPNWVDNTNWLTDAPLVEWYGVETDASGRVIGLDLGDLWDEERSEYVYQGLQGRIPAELVDLTKLERLSLGRNRLSGPIPPELGGLKNLTELSLHLNQLTGPIPSELGNLANLTYLHLSGNRLTGPIPSELGDLSDLTTLGLGENLLAGQIPPELGNLANLTYLRLSGNRLTGPIPPEFGNLSNLTALYLAGNELTGPIPPELGNLANLTLLQLNDSGVTGPIPPELGNLSKLTTLRLGWNRLTGPIPLELGNLANLTALALVDNHLTGPIPPELGNLANLTSLDLADNQLTGPIPRRFLNLDQLRLLDLSGTDICVPGTSAFTSWLAANNLQDQPVGFCNATDIVVLESLFSMAGGAGWAKSGGWADGAVLGNRYGISADSLGRVVTLDLTNNGLSGRLPANLGALAAMTGLRIGGNALLGRLPLSLARAPLKELHYKNTGLCAPAERTFQSWIGAIPSHEGTGIECAPISDREILEAFYGATGGGNWVNNENWGTDAPLGDWHGVSVDGNGRVIKLDLNANALSGSIPPEMGDLSRLMSLDLQANELTGRMPHELGSLASLTSLNLDANQLTGPIPATLGNLTNLTGLTLLANRLTGPIPSELGGLDNLTSLRLSGNPLKGSIPPELGKLSNLTELLLTQNLLTGPIPPELGGLANLRILQLYYNELNGPIPPELGNLSNLTTLILRNNLLVGPLPPELGSLSNLTQLNLAVNQLTGPVPSEFRGLTSLRELSLSNNPGMAGPLPTGLAALNRLEQFQAGGTNLCAPSDPGFRTWLQGIREGWIGLCSDEELPPAYLTQAVQSRRFPVPLVAGEKALLRVFPAANRATSESIPAARARFYLDGQETHVEEIPGGAATIPMEVDEGDLDRSVNARIPGHLIQPGLEMVIEIDPEGTLDPALGVIARIPTSGRMAVEVGSMPLFHLTLIPFIWQERGDSSIVDLVKEISADPEHHDMLGATRTLLPVANLQVRAHEPVLSSSNNGSDLHLQTKAVHVVEGATGHYIGMMPRPVTGPSGQAAQPGLTSFAIPDGFVIAHELGHNLNLGHAPCVAIGDPRFPYPDGSIGAWGYDFTGGGRLLSPLTADLMSYCLPQWISDYHFIHAFRYRLSDAGAAEPSRSVSASRGLLLWGGVDAEGVPFMEPAFVVDSPPEVPEVPGTYMLIGRAVGDAELFTLSFDMPETADGDGRSSFVFALPLQPEWTGNLARITLSGPGGSATLDGSTDRPMAILRDLQTGQVRAFLSDLSAEEAAQAAEGAFAAKPGMEVLFSRGIPDLR